MSLSARGIVVEENLATLLSRLVEQGLLTLEPAEGYPHRVYKITERGRAYLATQP